MEGYILTRAFLLRPVFSHKRTQFLQRHPSGSLEKESRIRCNKFNQHLLGFFLVLTGTDVLHITLQCRFREPARAGAHSHKCVNGELGGILADFAVKSLGEGLELEHIAYHRDLARSRRACVSP